MRWARKAAPIAGGMGLLAAGLWFAQGRSAGRWFMSANSSASGMGVVDDGVAAMRSDESATSPADAYNERQGVSASQCPPASMPQMLILNSAAAMAPHPDKVAKGGEDAYFMGDNSRCMGVADGVGGWADIGVDAGEYSRLLMSSAMSAASRIDPAPDAPQRILQAAYRKTNVRGSSTACVLVLHGDELYAANLGDSGFMVVRGEDVIFQSPQQQHDFNFPYQLGSPGTVSDSPSAAQIFSIKVQVGDVVIVGTDGLLDNVFPDQAAAIAAVAYRKGEPPQVAAQALTTFAQQRAADRRYMSPFAYAAQAMGYYYLGGKMDDITVIVSYVTEAPAAPMPAADGNGGGPGDSPPVKSKL